MFVFVAFSTALLVAQTRGQTMVGNCNLTAFSGGGEKCQREMIITLRNNNTSNCSTAYGNQSACVSTHVQDCVKDDGLLNAVKGDISQLLLLLLYHCGNLGYSVQDINPLILSYVKCNADQLTQIVTCWDDFRATFQANSSDPALCRKYADGKQKCTNIARQSCVGICDYIPKDEYNPFCSNGMDPPGTSELFDCVFSLGCPSQVLFETAKKCDEQIYITDFAKSPMDCSTEQNKYVDCLRTNLIGKCPSIEKSARVFQDAVNVIDPILTKRLFCGKVPALRADSLHRSVKELANCKPEFLTSAEKCAEPFRKTYSEASTKKSSGVCSAFSEAKQCLNKAHEDNCGFNEATRKAVMFGNENPFCEGGKDPQKAGADRSETTATPFLISFSIALSLIN